MAYPPVPAYPNAIDSDYTLFAVYNTTETRLCSDNSAWADEIEIVPSTDFEIWADNGFGNISGELFYYDSVEKNSDGRVVKLKNCGRNLSGNKTKFNPKGTWVRSFVVAEHHNQLVDTILKIEDFVGYNFDPRQVTLDWRIRNLRALNVITDDFLCPDVNFTFNILENNPETGILARYNIQITPPGSINSFRLDFGDGDFTTTDLFGFHTYSQNAPIDPVLTLSNDKCQTISTPTQRTNPTEPPPIIADEFTVEIPEVPGVPDFTFVPCVVPEPQINIPPIVFPCPSVQVNGQPSVIIGPDINMVSQVTITGPDNPVQVLFSTVEIIGGFSIPSIVFFDVPPTIVIDPPIPPTIVIVTQSSIAMGINFGEVPKIGIDWGAPPTMEVALTLAKPMRSISMGDSVQNEFGDEFADLFDAADHVKVGYSSLGIPTRIDIIPPVLPKLEIDSDNIPRSIKLEVDELTFPKNIKIHGPDSPIPTVISMDASSIPKQVMLTPSKDLPHQFELVTKIQSIELVMEKPIPDKISVEMIKPIPTNITVDGSTIPTVISVVGFKDIISIVGFPDGIRLLPPETMPPVEMVWKGDPIEVKLTMDNLMTVNEDGETKAQCVMIVPCPR
jgi:hypothetical protein